MAPRDLLKLPSSSFREAIPSLAPSPSPPQSPIPDQDPDLARGSVAAGSGHDASAPGSLPPPGPAAAAPGERGDSDAAPAEGGR